MKRILVPTQSAEDWKRLLAKPDLHWKPGRSAMSTATSWEAASGLPTEIKAALDAGPPELQGLELLLAIPEWEVALPGGNTTSHTDVMAVARNERGLVVIGVEAKVDEPFGPTLGEKRAEASAGQQARLTYLHETLGRKEELPDGIRYQLLHRTASAILTARAFHAATAVMLVQSFSPESMWFEDFEAFSAALGAKVAKGALAQVPALSKPTLFVGWCSGT